MIVPFCLVSMCRHDTGRTARFATLGAIRPFMTGYPYQYLMPASLREQTFQETSRQRSPAWSGIRIASFFPLFLVKNRALVGTIDGPAKNASNRIWRTIP